MSLTEIKHIFKEGAIMLQISEIVKKTRELGKRMEYTVCRRMGLMMFQIRNGIAGNN